MTQYPSIQDIKQLLETIRVEASPDIAYIYDIDEHINRLLISIRELDFSLPQGINNQEDFILLLRNQVKNKTQYFFKALVNFLGSKLEARSLKLISIRPPASSLQPLALFKLRIVYNQDGSFEIGIEPYTRDLKKTWQVKILDPKEFHIETTNPIWKHKFLPRPDTQSLSHSATKYNEIIWTNEHGHICEGSFTNVFFFNAQGQLCTPSLDCNILPGIMRNKIMENFEVVEGNYYPQDLENGFFLVNSMFVKDIKASTLS